MALGANVRHILVFLVLAVAPGFNDATAAEHDAGMWAIFSTTSSFDTDSRWHYWFDAQARYFDLGTGINQWLARPAIGYAFGNGIKGWLGYARFRTRSRSGNTADENRYWQQVDWTAGQWLGGRLALRARLAQRFVSVGDDTGLVLRLMAKYQYSLGNGDNKLVVGVEPFFSLRDTDWGGDAGLVQNRVFLGVNSRINEHLTLEYGYLNQYLFLDNSSDRANHLGIVNFRVAL